MKSIVVLLVIITLAVKCVKSSLISNVNAAFEVFSPKSMIRFFEFNDVGWNISSFCIRDLYAYLDGLQKDLLWTYKLLDASGNYAGGFFYGQNLRPANPDQCYELNEELNVVLSQESEKNLFNSSHTVPFFVNLINAKYSTYVNDMKREIFQISCMPISCSYDDLVQVMSYTSLAPDTQLLKNTELVEIRVLYQNYKFYLDINFTIIVAIASVMLLVNFGISFYGCYYRSKMKTMKNEKYKRNISCRPEVNLVENLKHTRSCSKSSSQSVKTDDSQVHQEVKLCRSKITNFKMNESAESLTISSKNCNHLNLVKLQKNKSDNTITLDIISTNCSANPHRKKEHGNQLDRAGETRKNIFKFSFQHQLSVSTPSDTPHDKVNENKGIHGIRVFSLFWIILLNVTSALSYASNNTKYLEAKDSSWIFHLIFKNGSFSIDTYFFVNGFLLCQFFYNSSRELKIHDVRGISEHFKHYFFLVIYKIFRILLPYLTIIHSLRIAMKHFNENSILSVPSNDHLTCDNIWKNLLFLDNFGPYEKRCSLWTWYISLELQFYVVALLILMLSKNSSKFALIIFAAFFTSTFFTSTAMDMRSNKLTHISNFTDEEKLMYFNGIYDHPLVHLGPYLVGIFYGYFTYNYDKKVRVNSMVLIIGWITSIVLFTLLMMSSFKLESVDPWLKSSFSTISHTFWSLILLWICFATMSSDRGFLSSLFSSDVVRLLSKTSNSVLLIHPLVTRLFILSSNNAIFVSVQSIVVAFFGFAIISFVCGLFFYIIFEAPVVTLLNILYERLVEKSKSNNPC